MSVEGRVRLGEGRRKAGPSACAKASTSAQLRRDESARQEVEGLPLRLATRRFLGRVAHAWSPTKVWDEIF
ncbi:MAG: hypothetical protein C5B50_03610 [Verrucomicrobia bacterium]|nr:MAG: hypothetical protein C5B50_03610 [Verrucomicrobiota bacterium]